MRTYLFKAALLGVASVLTSSCGLITGVKQCRFETRGAMASGEIILADGSTIKASAGLGEKRESSSKPIIATVNVIAESSVLYGHMTRGELRDNHTPSRLLASYLPGSTPWAFSPYLVGGATPYNWPVSFDEAFTLITSGQLVIEITTDLPDQPLVRIPLTTATPSGSWYREKGDACG
jgi:hypothetical protein